MNIFWEGFLDWRVLLKSWEHTQRDDHTIEVLWIPRVDSLEFWSVSSFWIIDDEALGNLMGAAWIKRDRIMDL